MDDALRDERVLIVDDEPDIVTVVRARLEVQGYSHVASATSGAEALRSCAELLPHAILLDLSMPLMDGYAVMEALAERYGNEAPPILVLTALHGGGSRERAFGLGARDYITKPLDFAELTARLRNVLEAGLLNRRLSLANRQLEGATRRMEAVLESVLEAIITIDASGDIAMVNPEVEQIWGYSAEELVGQPLTRLMPETYRAAHTAGVARYLRTREPSVLGQRVELEGLRSDGTIFPMELRIAETDSDDGMFFTAAVRDLTQRKQAERALRASEERFRQVFEKAPVGIALADADGKLVDANARFQALLDRSMDDLRGLTPLDYAHPDDQNTNRAMLDELVSGARATYSGSKRYVRPTGEVVWGRRTVSAVHDASGEFEYALSLVEDITEQRLAEDAARRQEAFEALVTRLATRFVGLPAQEIDDGITNALGDIARFTHVDRAYIYLVDEAQGAMSVAYRYPSDEGEVSGGAPAAIPEDIATALAQALTVDGQIGVGDRRDGHNLNAAWEWFAGHGITSGIISPLRSDNALLGLVGLDAHEDRATWPDESGSVLQLVEQVFVSALERKRREGALVRAHSQGRVDVVETVLHNIGNAINSVTIGIDSIGRDLASDTLVSRLAGLASILQDQRDDLADYLAHDEQGKQVSPYLSALVDDLENQHAAFRATVDRVGKRAEHVADIVRAQRDMDRSYGHMKDIDPTAALGDALNIMGDSLAKRGIRVTQDMEAAPPLFRTQESMFVQMAVNLLKNAIEATDERQGDGASEIDVRIVGDGTRLVFEVSDNGVGIAPDLVQDIYRAGYTTKVEGTGMGLYSVRDFARACGGDVEITSEGLGRGATVRVVLPFLTRGQQGQEVRS
jgi:PAS domain S-box-containing protein